MGKGRGWLLAGAMLLLAPIQAQAFGTIHGLGQDAEHERITRQGLAQYGLAPATMDELAGRRGTFGAVGAPDRPNRGLMSASEAHCDNGDWLDTPGYPRSREEAQAVLESCRAWIFEHMEQAVREAAALVTPDLVVNEDETGLYCRFDGDDRTGKCAVLDELGLALHASQDFYSHSNWVDPLRRAGLRLDDPPGLGQAAPTDWLDMSRADDRYPEGLISGCYEGFPESRHCEGRVKHATLNKDGKGSSRGRGGVYRLAMAVAAEDTRARWAWFEHRLVEVYGRTRGGRMACVIKSDDPKVCRA